MTSTATQVAPVVLPPGEWISHWHITRAIAQAFHPDRRDASGVWLITHKTPLEGPAAGLPFSITEADLQLLAEVEERLPRLTLETTASEWGAFLKAFRQISFQPPVDWAPLQPSASDLYVAYCAGGAVGEQHLDAFRGLLAQDKLRAISSSRAKVRNISADTLLHRKDVESYFRDVGITYSDKTSTEAKNGVAAVDGAADEEPETAKTRTHRAGRASTPRWTEALVQQLRASVADETVSWKQREELFDCSRQRMVEVLKEHDKRQADKASKEAGAIGSMAKVIIKRI